MFRSLNANSILPIKMEVEGEETYKEILSQYDKFNVFLAGKLDARDMIEKKLENQSI